MKIVILTLSYKKGGKCIAGIDLNSHKWARLVTDDEESNGTVPDDYLHCSDGSDIELLDVINAPTKGACQDEFQPENVFLDVDRPFEKLGRMSLDQVLEIHPLEKEDPIFGNYFGNIRKDLARGFGYSLILVEVSNLVIKTAKNNAGKNKRKADFIYQGKKYTDISMTDPNYINCEDGTCYKRAKLVISMGRPYGEGRNCYKFIAAIFVE